MVLVGIAAADTVTELGLTWLPHQCKTIAGTLYGNIQIQKEITTLVNMVKKGDHRLGKLVTKKVKVEEINDVAEVMRKRQIIGRLACEWN